MKCLILAAGYATRLYPLTENFPKPLLDVGGKTILDWLLDDLDATGAIDGYIVVTNHKFADIFRKWSSRSASIQVLDDGTTTNEGRLGAVKDIQFAIEQLGIDDDVLVMAGDNLLTFSLQPFIEFFRQKGTSCVMRYYEPELTRLRKTGVLHHAPYPTAQKCLPQYRFRNIGNSSCNRRELLPFRRFTKSLTLIDGGYSTCMWMWSLLTTPLRMRTSSLSHTCTNMSRHRFCTSPVNTAYLYFVTHTI